MSGNNMEDRMSFAVVGVLLTLLRLLDCVTFQPSHPIILQENARAEIKCQHDDDALTVMLWYQRRPQNNTLSLIGNSYFGSDPNYEEGFKDQFELTRESKLKGTLQSSAKIVRKGSKGIQIDCSHDDSNYVLMYWYQRKDENTSLTLIGFGYESSPQNYEDRFEEQFNITRESVLQGTLVLTEAAESDSAVYFCAASTR